MLDWIFALALTQTVPGGGASTSQDAPAAREDSPEIVIIGKRYGEAPVAAETEFEEAELAAQGADSIGDLLSRLQPFIDSSGDAPILLINGKPAGFDRSILSFPAEALARLTVLKPEAAARYGERSGQRVVNLVLKQRFSALNADGAAYFPTRGGQFGGDLGLMQTAIRGETRWNAQLRITRQSALRKRARRVAPGDGVFDGIGFVSGAEGGEIDPALSLAAGAPVTFAAFPKWTGLPPLLGDFIPTANRRDPIDPRDFETLAPSRHTVTLGLGVTRPVGGLTLSLNLNAFRSDVAALRGVPMATLVLPAASQWSPFANTVLLTRPFAVTRALRLDSRSRSLSASFDANGRVAGFQSSLGFGISQSEGRNLVETGIDIEPLQAAIDGGDGALDPYGPLGPALLRATRDRSRSQTLNARLNLLRSVLDLPAGAIAWSLSSSGGQSRNTLVQRDQHGEIRQSARTSAAQGNGQMALDVPISRRGTRFAALGDLSIDVSASAQAMTGSGVQSGWSAGLNWSPVATLQLRGAIDRSQIVPSLDQLNGPRFTTSNRVYDYAREEIATPDWTTGGNPDLGRGSQQNLWLTLNARPLGGQAATLNLGYRQSVAKGGPAAFPELTPAVERAFPERITRDSQGRLVAVDARAIRIERKESASLNSGVALRLGGIKRGVQRRRDGPFPDPVQFTVTLDHRFQIRNETLIRRGLPVIDRRNGDSGASRHLLNLRLGAGKRAYGGNLNASWSSATRVRGSVAGSDFIVRPSPIANLSAFASLDDLFGARRGWLDGLKLSLDVQNLFAGYRRVTRADGSAPPGYGRDDIDPLGRTVRLTLRKKL